MLEPTKGFQYFTNIPLVKLVSIFLSDTTVAVKTYHDPFGNIWIDRRKHVTLNEKAMMQQLYFCCPSVLLSKVLAKDMPIVPEICGSMILMAKEMDFWY